MIDHQDWIPFSRRKQYSNKNVFYNTELSDLSMKIYRYIDIDYLEELLRDNKLFVNNRKNSEDLFEHEESANHGRKDAGIQICITSPTTTKKPQESHRLSQAEKEDYHICISSWADESRLNNKTDENIFSWGYYSKNLPQNHYLCRIETTMEDLINSIQEKQLNIWIGRANYHIGSSKWFLNNRIFGRPQEYEVENEIRMCIQQVTDDNYYLRINPAKMIHEIRISPYCPIDKAKKICEKLKNEYKIEPSKIKISKIRLIH